MPCSLSHYTVPDAPDKRKRSLQFKSSHVRLITKQPAAILRCLAARGSNFRHCILAAVYNWNAKEHWFRYLARFASLQNIVENPFDNGAQYVREWFFFFFIFVSVCKVKYVFSYIICILKFKFKKCKNELGNANI